MSLFDDCCDHFSFLVFTSSAFATTVKDESAIAAPANIGDEESCIDCGIRAIGIKELTGRLGE